MTRRFEIDELPAMAVMTVRGHVREPVADSPPDRCLALEIWRGQDAQRCDIDTHCDVFRVTGRHNRLMSQWMEVCPGGRQATDPVAEPRARAGVAAGGTGVFDRAPMKRRLRQFSA